MMEVGAPAHAAEEATLLRNRFFSSRSTGQYIKSMCLSPAPRRMKDSENKAILGTTAVSKRPVCKY